MFYLLLYKETVEKEKVKIVGSMAMALCHNKSSATKEITARELSKGIKVSTLKTQRRMYVYDSEEERRKHIAKMELDGWCDIGKVRTNIGTSTKPLVVLYSELAKQNLEG